MSVLPATTMQESLFSHPQPSPSESAAGEEHTAGPLAALLPVLEGVELTVEDEPAVTRQLSLFSHPQPSPSSSAFAELHMGIPLAVLLAVLPDVDPEDAPLLTIQLLLFSQPQPSPSVSEAALLQTGSCANTAVEVISSNDAVSSLYFFTCFIFETLVKVVEGY